MTDKPYRTPKACYKKAPVRRETDFERRLRRMDQVPHYEDLEQLMARERHGFNTGFTINATLVPGRAQYIKEVSNG
jgi:hypothetical protein